MNLKSDYPVTNSVTIYGHLKSDKLVRIHSSSDYVTTIQLQIVAEL
jgi:hypothetical protein